MNLKKIKIISSFGIFILCFIFHFGYDVIHNSIGAFLFPVNESIWEHQKLLFTSVIVYGIIDYILLNKTKTKYNNFFVSLFLSSFLIVPIFLIIYLPLYNRYGPIMILNISIMAIAIIISQIISYYILKSEKNNKYLNKTALLLIIIEYILFGYFTYNPIKTHLFLDTEKEKYGINNYNI